jgi:peptidoglycan/LPS O-acetylase OafA/YrhL
MALSGSRNLRIFIYGLNDEPYLMTTGRLHGLDHLRALAILLVFFFHYQLGIFGHPPWLKDLAKFGWTGVDLFFVLSGFLISSQLFSEIKKTNSLSFKDFFLKRFFRIIPAFWITVVIYFCFPAFHEREALPPLWKYLTFTQNLSLNIAERGTFSHAWSLCVEEHFYLVLPLTLLGLLATGSLKKGYWVLPVLFLLGFFLRYYGWNLYQQHLEEENSWAYWYKYVYYPTYNRLDGLLIGVSIAAVYHFAPGTWAKISRRGNLVFLVGMIMLSIAYWICYEEHSFGASLFGFPVVAVGYGLLVISALSPTGFLYKFNSKVTSFIALLSYSVYLTHKGVIHISQDFLLQQGFDINSGLVMLLCFAACLLAALILTLVIEKPFMQIREKIFHLIKIKHEQKKLS